MHELLPDKSNLVIPIQKKLRTIKLLNDIQLILQKSYFELTQSGTVSSLSTQRENQAYLVLCPVEVARNSNVITSCITSVRQVACTFDNLLLVYISGSPGRRLQLLTPRPCDSFSCPVKLYMCSATFETSDGLPTSNKD